MSAFEKYIPPPKPYAGKWTTEKRREYARNQQRELKNKRERIAKASDMMLLALENMLAHGLTDSAREVGNACVTAYKEASK